MSRNFLLALVAITLAGCATTEPAALPPGQQLKITKQVWDTFQTYLVQKTSARPGTFVVTTDGVGVGYAVCPAMRCRGMGRDVAMDICKEDNPGKDCIVFAVSSDIIVPYEVLP